MSTRSDGGASSVGQDEHGRPPAAPYTLISLLDNVSLTESDGSDRSVRITCVDFWNDNLYIGTSDGEILHYVLLPPSDEAADSPTFILASRLRPESSAAASSSSQGVQQIAILPEPGKACILSNSTLTFYSLPELSPAYGGSVKVPKCAWISIVQHEAGGTTQTEDGTLLMICVDTRVQLIRLGERARKVRTIQLGGCLRAACSGGIACVANSRSYSLLDIVEQQQIPLFEINPQSSGDLPETPQKPLPGPPTSSIHGGSDTQSYLQAAHTTEQVPAVTDTQQDLAPADHKAEHQNTSDAPPPRTSSLNAEMQSGDPRSSHTADRPSSIARELSTGGSRASSQRRSSTQHARLNPTVVALNDSEFLLTTGTSLDDPGVGIFVNHDGDVVRGTLQFGSYPESLIVDTQRMEAATASRMLSGSPLASPDQDNVLAVVKKRNDGGWTRCIEIHDLSKSPDEEGASCILDPGIEESFSSQPSELSSLGIGKATSSKSVRLPNIATKLELCNFQGTLVTMGQTSNKSIPLNKHGSESHFTRQLSATTAQNLLWTTDSIWWVAPASIWGQLDAELDQAIEAHGKESATFVSRDAVVRVLVRIQTREDRQTAPDELVFIGNRYLRQKASLILLLDLVVQTAAGIMTYDRDRNLTEHLMAEGDVDPRVLVASIADLRDDIKIGNEGIWLQRGLNDAWLMFEQCEAANSSPDLQGRSWESLLQILKRYLMRWRRKKGFGSVAEDGALFESVDFALLQILLMLDRNHPRGRAIKGSARSELNTVVDEGVDCFDRAVELFERHDRLYILSRLYQGRRQYPKVLETWKRIVEGATDAGGELGDGEEEVRDYLIKRKDKEMVREYGTWLALRNPQMGVRVFADTKSQVRFDAREVIELLKARAPNAVKEYLERLVFGNNLSQYANDLIGYYLDSVLGEVESSEEAKEALRTSYETYRALAAPKPTYNQFATDNAINAAWWSNRLRLLQLLGGSHAAASQYDTVGILDRIEPYKNLLVPESIILSGRQRRHDDAIQLLVHGLGDFDTAVSYCVLGGAGTYGPVDGKGDNSMLPSHTEQSQLFRHLLREFLSVEDLSTGIVQTGELLGRFSRWFTIEEVLSTIPEDWSTDRVSSFFENALRVLQSERCEQLVFRALTSSENLSSSAKVVEKIESLGAILQAGNNDLVTGE